MVFLAGSLKSSRGMLFHKIYLSNQKIMLLTNLLLQGKLRLNSVVNLLNLLNLKVLFGVHWLTFAFFTLILLQPFILPNNLFNGILPEFSYKVRKLSRAVDGPCLSLRLLRCKCFGPFLSVFFNFRVNNLIS